MGHFLTLFNNFLKKVRKILCQLKFYGDFCIGPDDKNRREAIFGTKIERCACGGLFKALSDKSGVQTWKSVFKSFLEKKIINPAAKEVEG